MFQALRAIPIIIHLVRLLAKPAHSPTLVVVARPCPSQQHRFGQLASDIAILDACEQHVPQKSYICLRYSVLQGDGRNTTRCRRIGRQGFSSSGAARSA